MRHFAPLNCVSRCCVRVWFLVLCMTGLASEFSPGHKLNKTPTEEAPWRYLVSKLVNHDDPLVPPRIVVVVPPHRNNNTTIALLVGDGIIGGDKHSAIMLP